MDITPLSLSLSLSVCVCVCVCVSPSVDEYMFKSERSYLLLIKYKVFPIFYIDHFSLRGYFVKTIIRSIVYLALIVVHPLIC